MNCHDTRCEACGHLASRHRAPEAKDPTNPDGVVCMECLYGPRKR